MPKVVKPLTDKEIKASKAKEKEYKLSDGQSLYLVVKTNGTKFFRYDFTFEKKRKSMSFGIYPDISLAEARSLKDKAKELLKQNINPIVEKNSSNNVDETNIFKNIAEKWLSRMKNDWVDNTFIKVVNVLENHAYPYIGNKSIKDITRTDILNIIDRMNKKSLFGSAEKLISNINRIYKFAVTYNYVEHNIVADIDKKNVIISTRHNHYPAITNEDDVKELINDIQSFEDLFKADITTIIALKLAPLVTLRPFNLCSLEWSEINFEKEYLDVPANKMKTKKDFVMPLSKQAIKILKTIEPFSSHKSKYVFPSPTSNHKNINDATINHALKKLGYKDRHCTHGFRSTFSTITHEKVKEHGLNSDIIESCLAHEEHNQVKASYNRSSKMKYFEEKKELMQWWADWLDNLVK
ncbi:tyrosine-type recombinase/integrase [Aliarcobacter cryaerophilus]|uniref:Tyrosine-type recombinase/integrase n=1 Tax=Aliarcobacter cryaerophilus TaxID=28198 RepID=A0AA46N0S2_9BACT|nr:integrase arm-type DNA-binding domain-containing protein [Aliarcobacter cryaerophilus]UYF42721.1 tyrosine-type recombinase/integrase [Aliarcobacter cryaerophilus]